MAESKSKFPKVQGGGSLMLAWQVKGKKVLVIGAGSVAAGRILHCLNADALVTVIAPSSDSIDPEVAHRISTGAVTYIDRVFEPSDLGPPPSFCPAKSWTAKPSTTEPSTAEPSPGEPSTAEPSIAKPSTAEPSTAEPSPASPPTQPPSLVLIAIDDPVLSRQIYHLCASLRIPANVADVPPECDFFFGSVHRDGPIQIMVSTNGRGPRLAASLRRIVAAALPARAAAAVEAVGRLRVMLRQIAPAQEEGPKRMGWMSGVSDGYDWDDLAGLEEVDLRNLLRFYERGEVPPVEVLKGLRGKGEGEIDVFDGSFGFSVGA